MVLLLSGCTPEEPATVYPQDQLTLEYAMDRNTIHVGDPVELTVTALFPTNGVLQMPEIGREKDVVLLNRAWDEIPREDGLSESVYHYSLTSFRIGEHTISTDMVSCVAGDHTFSTPFPPVTLTVESSLTGEASSEIADIKPPLKLPGRMPPWLSISMLVALIAFAVGLVTSRLWKRRESVLPAAPAIPPDVVALQALEMLKNKGLLEKDECNPFYTELSKILRTYLEGRFHLNAPDETTEEIVEEMSKSPDLKGSHRNILQDFMRQADIVKFAKGHPDRTTMESAFETTKHFVEETKMVDEAVAPIGNHKSEIINSK